MSTLIMMRHGQSKWNKMNIFTGWVDVPLSEEGVRESLAGGEQIKDIPIDIIVTTSLIRAQMTALLAMSVHSSGKVPVMIHFEGGKLEEWGKIYGKDAEAHVIPVIRCWELNERMYGELQGLNKAETAEKFGEEQVKIWRRSYAIQPPKGESLADTAARSIPCFKQQIVPYLKKNLNVFISAHGNSLRSIIMYLEGLTKEQVVELEVPTGVPIIYQYHDEKFVKSNRT